MGASETVIEATGLVKRYGRRAAVDGVDLEMRRGEVLALLGPNGAGKTTTVEILEGFRSRDAGDVSVLGHDPARAGPAWRARLGIVLQTATDVSDLTVAETVHHFAGYYPAPAAPDEVIATVGLEPQRDTRCRLLSGGQRRRLDVALGIVGRPELLFLDEPTTGFDPQARRDFWGLIHRLRHEGVTVLLTTHYLDEAEHLADRVAVIADGRIVEVADTQSLGADHRRQAVVSWVDDDATPREVATEAPASVLRDLLSRYDGREVPQLAVRRPTLEDVYLRMIGHAVVVDDLDGPDGGPGAPR